MAASCSLLVGVLAAIAVCPTHAMGAAADDLTVDVFANSVMRGTPRCTLVVSNSFNFDLDKLCQGNVAAPLPPLDGNETSLRITGTLTAPATSMAWYNFSANVGTAAWVR